jgi:hypothetical protein
MIYRQEGDIVTIYSPDGEIEGTARLMRRLNWDEQNNIDTWSVYFIYHNRYADRTMSSFIPNTEGMYRGW